MSEQRHPNCQLPPGVKQRVFTSRTIPAKPKVDGAALVAHQRRLKAEAAERRARKATQA